MSDRCNKCKVSFRIGGDTWCIGCSAWETIGNELTSRWSGPLGIRRIADDVALSAARQIRALRSLGAGVSLAPAPRVAESAKEEEEEVEKEEKKAAPGLAAKARVTEPPSEYEYTYTEEECDEPEERRKEKAGSAGDKRPALARLGRSESSRRGDVPVRAEAPVVVKEEKIFEEKRQEREETPNTRGSKRKASEGKEKEKKKKKDKKEGDRRRKRRRGGRKHQQLSRLGDNPFRPHHRRLSGEVLEGRASLDLQHWALEKAQWRLRPLRLLWKGVKWRKER